MRTGLPKWVTSSLLCKSNFRWTMTCLCSQPWRGVKGGLAGPARQMWEDSEYVASTRTNCAMEFTRISFTGAGLHMAFFCPTRKTSGNIPYSGGPHWIPAHPTGRS